jgi:hypothetical protein
MKVSKKNSLPGDEEAGSHLVLVILLHFIEVHLLGGGFIFR